MSRTLTAREIGENALRMIGAFPVTESAADGEQLRLALTWLDLILAEISGTTELFWQVADTISLTLENERQEYPLGETLGADFPPDGLQFPRSAYLEDEMGNRHPLTIVKRDKFEDVSRPAKPGIPKWLYLNRLPTPTLRVYPTLGEQTPITYQVKLVVQTYSPNVAPSGVSGSRPSGSILTEFRTAWQRFLIYRLAHDLGNGPIHKLAERSLARIERQAADSFRRLEAFENRQHDTEPPLSDGWGLDDDFWRHGGSNRGYRS